jgi:hypothetical protein
VHNAYTEFHENVTGFGCCYLATEMAVLHIKHLSLLFSKECLKMDVDYDNFKKGKNVHKLHDYNYSENTDNANCACKPCEKPILYQILE